MGNSTSNSSNEVQLGDYARFDAQNDGQKDDSYSAGAHASKTLKGSVAQEVRLTRTLSEAAFDEEIAATAGIPGAVFNFTNSMFVYINFFVFHFNYPLFTLFTISRAKTQTIFTFFFFLV